MDIHSDKFRPVHVALLLVRGFPLMSYASLVEPLRAANLISGRQCFKLTRHAVEGGLISSSSGDVVRCRLLPHHEPDPDFLFVVAGGNPHRIDDPEIYSWLRRLARHKVTICGISGGPVVLAQAGIMSGYRMTVHWDHAPVLQERMTDLYLERSLFVVDRDRITCAGGIASLDLMHTLIVRHYGTGLANQVSDWFLHTEIRQPEGTQRAGLVERYGTTRRPLIEALAQMENHIADPLTLGQIAELSGIGERHLNRLFRIELGCSTMARYRTMRLDHARKLLLGTTLSITEIALATGYSGPSHFASRFRSEFGVSPSRLRNER